MEDKMEKIKKVKTGVCNMSHRSEILGIIFLAIATILTILTFSDLGILGMFLVGSVFCCHKHWGRRCKCGCECCSEPNMAFEDPDMTCTTTVSQHKPVVHHKKQSVTVKKTTAKKP